MTAPTPLRPGEVPAPTGTRPGGRGRAVAILRTGYGALLLVRPDLAARLFGAAPRGGHPVLRLLGLRHLAEAGLLLTRPAPGVVTAAAGIDAGHVLSCLVLAAVGRAHRRPALRDAVLESTLLLATWTTGARSSAHPPPDGTSGAPGPVHP